MLYVNPETKPFNTKQKYTTLINQFLAKSQKQNSM